MGVFDGSLYVVNIREADDSESDHIAGSVAEAQAIVDRARVDGAKAAMVEHAHYVRSGTGTDMGFGDFWGYEDEEDD